jgi:hypothetical protein
LNHMETTTITGKNEQLIRKPTICKYALANSPNP